MKQRIVLRAMLELGEYQGVRIMTSREFLEARVIICMPVVPEAVIARRDRS